MTRNRSIAKVAVIGSAVAVLAAWALMRQERPSAVSPATVVVVREHPARVAASAATATRAIDTRRPIAGSAAPAEIPGKVAFERVSDAYPRAFGMLVTITDPPGPALTALDAAAAALDRGEADAGFTMYMAIRRCEDRALTEQARELEDAAGDAANYERLLARNETTLRDCAGVGVAEIARAYAGLKTAAERGDVLAQVWYATVGAAHHASTPRAADGFRRDALRFLETAASRGNVQAMRALARTYDSGTLAAVDAQKSYVYTYAMYLLEPGPDAARRIDEAAGALSPEQIGAAQREAGRLLVRCCR